MLSDQLVESVDVRAFPVIKKADVRRSRLLSEGFDVWRRAVA